jgi:hypothetical protein
VLSAEVNDATLESLQGKQYFRAGKQEITDEDS